MDANSIAADIGLSADTAATLADYEKQLDGAGRGELSDEIDRLIRSPELQQVEMGKQKLAQGMLLVATAHLEGGGTMVSTLPKGVRTPADLMNPDPAHDKLATVEEELKGLEKAGITEGEQHTRLMNMRTDILRDLKETGDLRNTVESQNAANNEAEKLAREQKTTAEYDELLGRTTRQKERLYPGNKEMAAKEAKTEVDRFFARQTSGGY